jgi:hypothetical protein
MVAGYNHRAVPELLALFGAIAAVSGGGSNLPAFAVPPPAIADYRRHIRRHHRGSGTSTKFHTRATAAMHRHVASGNDDDDDDGPPYEVSTISDLNDYFDDVRNRFRRRNPFSCVRRGLRRRRSRQRGAGGEDGYDIDHSSLLSSLSVRGDTQIVGDATRLDVVHPVSKLLHDRRRRIEMMSSSSMSMPTIPTNNSSTASFRNERGIRRTLPSPDDGYRVALSIEGGGMRGCVTAGMVAAIHHLGLSDTFDVVYGSSAGTVIGAYFITRQLPHFGPEVYYDMLTTAGDGFINAKRFLRAIGLGLLDPRLTKDVSLFFYTYGYSIDILVLSSSVARRRMYLTCCP